LVLAKLLLILVALINALNLPIVHQLNLDPSAILELAILTNANLTKIVSLLLQVLMFGITVNQTETEDKKYVFLTLNVKIALVVTIKILAPKMSVSQNMDIAETFKDVTITMLVPTISAQLLAMDNLSLALTLQFLALPILTFLRLTSQHSLMEKRLNGSENVTKLKDVSLVL